MLVQRLRQRSATLARLAQNRARPSLSRESNIMTEPAALPAVPDHLSTDPRSPHYNAAAFEHEVGIRLNGAERFDVAEYCISEGWVRVPSGKTVDRKGNPLLIKLKGQVEAFYRSAGAAGDAPPAPAPSPSRSPPPLGAGIRSRWGGR